MIKKHFKKMAIVISSGFLFSAFGAEKAISLSYPADLISHWSFDEGTGINGDDPVGSHDVTLFNGPTWVTGRRGSALQMDGINDYASPGVHADFTPGSSGWTVAAWIKVPVINNNQEKAIVSWYRCGANPGCNTPDSALYTLSLNTDGKASWYVRDDNQHGDLMDLVSLNSLADNQWHYLAGTFDLQNDNMKLFVDGSLIASQAIPFTTLTTGGFSIPLSLGRTDRTGWASPWQYFQGSIDEVSIYRRALTEKEILHQYASVPEPTTLLLLGSGLLGLLGLRRKK